MGEAEFFFSSYSFLELGICNTPKTVLICAPTLPDWEFPKQPVMQVTPVRTTSDLNGRGCPVTSGMRDSGLKQMSLSLWIFQPHLRVPVSSSVSTSVGNELELWCALQQFRPPWKPKPGFGPLHSTQREYRIFPSALKIHLDVGERTP